MTLLAGLRASKATKKTDSQFPVVLFADITLFENTVLREDGLHLFHRVPQEVAAVFQQTPDVTFTGLIHLELFQKRHIHV